MKDVDSPVKNKGSRISATNDDTEDGPLMKAGDPIKAKYQEKLSRRAASDDDEPFVPRPNTRIKFQLPDSTVTPSEESPGTAQQLDIEPVTVPEFGTASNVAAVVGLPHQDDLIPAALSDPSPAANLAGEDATVAANALALRNNPGLPANDDQTLI